MTESTGPEVLIPVGQYDLGNAGPPGQPPAAATHAALDANLIKARQAERITGFRIEGVTTGSEQERFIKYYVVQGSDKTRWGRECRWVLPIGLPGASSTPVGRIIMRWTAGGYCQARLIADGPVTIKPSGTVQVLAEALRQRWNIRSVIGRGADWTEDELRKVLLALLKMPQQDRAALDGIDLVRTPQVDQAEQNTDAHFHLLQELDSQQLVITDFAELVVGNGTFEQDQQVFVGSDPGQTLPVSCQKILHEVGHAVEHAACRRKFSAKLTANLEVNRLVSESSGTVTPEQQARYDQAQARLRQASKEMAATLDPASNRSIPLQAFVTLVNTRNISRRLTRYADDNWPNAPAEFYADAYSLWLLDPQSVTGFSADLAGFFTDGTYRPAG